MKPGDILEGPIQFTVCATINNLDQYLTIPTEVVRRAIEAAGLTPHWPLGVFAVFRPEGVLMCIYGHNASGDFDLKRSLIELQEDVPPSIGAAVWKMWKALRDTPEEVLEANYTRLYEQTQS